MKHKCPTCDTVWNHDDLDSAAWWTNETIEQVRERFYSEGCGAVFYRSEHWALENEVAS